MARANLSATGSIDEWRRSEMGNVERIFWGADLLALIIRAEFCEPGIHFLPTMPCRSSWRLCGTRRAS